MTNDLEDRPRVFCFDYFEKPSLQMNVDIQLMGCRITMKITSANYITLAPNKVDRIL